jgi:hypothetical protein
LELELVNQANRVSDRNNPCSSMLDGVLYPGSIPGLDADMCRCPECLTRAVAGIWWTNEWMRERIRLRKTAFRFNLTSGEAVRDSE